MSAGEKRKREELEHGQARDDKFRHLLSKWHLYITTKTCCPPAREWTGVVGKQQRVTLFSAYLVHNTYIQQTGYRLACLSRSLTAYVYIFSRTACIHVTSVQSPSRFTLHTNDCNSQRNARGS